MSSSPSSLTKDRGVSTTTRPLETDVYPVGSCILVYWSGERQWFKANVTDSRTEVHKVKGVKISCREVFCRYDEDGHEQWHAIHNNRIRWFNPGKTSFETGSRFEN